VKHILLLAFGIVCLTAFLGIALSALELNYLTSCFGHKSRVPALLFASLGGAGLAYTIWSNRKNMSPHGKPTRLAVATLLFGPVIGLFMQIVIPMMSTLRLDGHWPNLALYALMLLFFLSIGNYVTTTRRDGFGGIRNSWTLSSRVIWANTQRLHGYLLVLGGLATIFLILISSVATGMYALPVIYLTSICVATAYSAYLSFSLKPAL